MKSRNRRHWLASTSIIAILAHHAWANAVEARRKADEARLAAMEAQGSA